MNRRTFLKMAGMGSIAFTAGCSPDPNSRLYSLVKAPDDMVVGEPTWYASTCRECPAGCGVIAKNREGRVIKLEGNPLHPVNRGRLCLRGQAALQAVYDPDRITAPMVRENGGWRKISLAEALELVRTKTARAARKGPNRVRLLSEVMGETALGLAREALGRWNSEGPTIFEPYAYESLRTANAAVFGIEGLFGHRLDQADVLLAFGADFLETWLSPVEYARDFKAMHAYHSGRKGLFMMASPFQSLTAANADAWVGCRPGTEAALALGLLQVALDVGRADNLPFALRSFLEEITTPYAKAKVVETSGIAPAQYDYMATRLFQAESPLVLGTGVAAAGNNSLATELAVNLLNRVLDPSLARLDSGRRLRVETAARRSMIIQLLAELTEGQADVLLLNGVNPSYALPPDAGVAAALSAPGLFVVSFANFMDETTAQADLILPVQLPLETWDEYAPAPNAAGVQQPTMGQLTDAPALGDVLLQTAWRGDAPAADYRAYLAAQLKARLGVWAAADWIQTLQRGGVFDTGAATASVQDPADIDLDLLARAWKQVQPPSEGTVFIAAPSIRYFDGRGANRAWLNEVPDPLTRVAWQAPVLMHPDTAADLGTAEGRWITLRNGPLTCEAPVYAWEGVKQGVLVMTAGQGHTALGRFARRQGANPFGLLAADLAPLDGAPIHQVPYLQVDPSAITRRLATTSGSRTQHERKIAVQVALEDARHPAQDHPPGLTMWDFPLALPLPEGYDPKRDFYPPHEHAGYRWAMVVDLDRCIGCGACAVACYAENNVGVVGEERIIEGREMAWLTIQRYLDSPDGRRVTFLPMLCQHCDDAPCESVCPVYAPHHNKEGLNNQIYNRCIGTRFCSQNCPYKVRRFNWFSWQWPSPLNLQLNPDVTVRAKGVMEKCSFCVQRIKAAHDVAKNEKRAIRDGEVVTACVQTCPTGALSFGSLMDPASRVRRLVDDPRAYQVMGYLNTKPAVIYLKKVVQEA